jgi:hypothetical protein
MTISDPEAIVRDRFYSVPELATHFRTGRRTVDGAINRGELQAVALNRRGDRRVRGEWAIHWLEQRRVSR